MANTAMSFLAGAGVAFFCVYVLLPSLERMLEWDLKRWPWSKQ